ncbi:deoxyribose-phosphate aldolase [Geothrix edaphica]|uniref:Deoxyribose-phosphate aldolase n=1 Tax=Geothrix edaphica TaxID=2927976 RepID=A0ABQ5PYF5_9BACT|nr:deoxyribose-phosphate aldolase [Geothrix edaphica]GLH67318.1 deoxyribose-phosphate aldolase [Geothrix edaphica]
MIDPLLDLTAEVRARLQVLPEGGRPQLLGCVEGFCMLRDQAGLHHRPAGQAALPAGPWDLSPLIDHTLLKAEATGAQVERLCAEALKHGFASVCINPLWVPLASSLLKGSAVRTCTVVGFPLGASSLRAKAHEAELAVRDGAQEVDMVLAVGAAKADDWDTVRRDLEGLRAAVPAPTVLKVILETCLLTDTEKTRASTLALEAGLDFVKTSTGFSTGGATEADVALMRRTVGTAMGVKASGGIRTYEGALAMVLAGATRLGLSASVAVIQGGAGSEAY